MAQRRMFSMHIVDTDAFLEMPTSTQNLYFHLGMRADDDGFVSNPKKIMKMVGSQEDDLKILLSKRFLLGFETGIIVIKHWRINNLLRKDRYNETVYLEEKARLDIKDNRAYTELKECQPNDNQPVTQYSIVKVSKVKDSQDKKQSYFDFNNVTLKEDEYNKLIDKFGTDKVRAIIKKLSSYKMAHGRKYKSDYGAINQWVLESLGLKDCEENNNPNLEVTGV